MNFRNLSAWSIRNPIPPIVMFVMLTVAGIFSFNNMDVNDNPDVDAPFVDVFVAQPGAAPTEIETQITQRVEAAVRNISGVKTISSTAREGRSGTSVEFEIGRDPNQAVNDVKNAVDQIRSDLPDGILEPQVTKNEINGNTLAFFGVSATDMTLEQLSWFVDDTVSKRLLSVDGMGSVSRSGGVDREIRVILDPARMQAQGVTAAQINSQLRQTNLNAAGGQAEIAGSRQSVRILGNAESAYALGQTQISLGGGRSIKLDQVADVRDSFAEQTSIGKSKGKQVVTFSLQRAKGASDVSVYDDSMAVIEQIKKDNPGVEFEQLFASVKYTKSQYASSMATMIEGAVLAIVVVFFFLRDWRATIVAAVAIPLSAIPTFYFMELMGFSLNTLSLLALGLVAGVLVDDAIVEIENIVRHMRMGKTAYQASIDAADEIGLAVLATTGAIVAVFLPVGLMPGISGQFFKNFGFTVVAAVLMSLAVARMITPLMSAYFMEAKGQMSHGEGPVMDRYMSILKWTLDNRWWTMGFGVLALLATVVSIMTLPSQFFPTTNSDFSRAQITMVPGTTLEQTEAVADRVQEILDSQPEVQTSFSRIREGNARVYSTLRDERDRTSMDFERDLTPLLQDIPDARVSFLSQNGGGGTGRDISVMLTGSDPALLEDTAAQLVEQMKGLSEVVAPRVNADLQRPEIIVRPQLDLAANLGVTTAALSQTIRIATMGDIDQNSAKFSLSDRQIPIRVALPKESRRSLDTIRNLPVPTASGGSVPLSRVADISFGSGPTTIQRYNQARRIFVGADLALNVVKSDATKKINELPIMKDLPQGVSNRAFGQDEWQQEMMTNFIVALVSGVFLVFAVLVLLYKRVIAPLVNMGSLLLAPLGGFLALHLTGNVISMPVFIGTLMLLGIVAKNSILLVDFALDEMDRGVPKYKAIMEAGHKRAQPIVMTTVAMVAGMVPTAVSIGGDGAWRAPMGVTVIGGLIVSTILTLLIIPAAFSLADGFEKKLAPKLGRLLTYKDGDDGKAVDPPRPPAATNDGTQPAE